MIQLIMRIYRWLKPFLNKLTHDNIYAIAGQSAFFLLLSAVPLAIFGVSILQNLHIPVETLNSFFSIVFNEEVSQSFAQFMSNVYESATGVSLVAIIVTLWSAAKGIQAITNGLNRVHETYENRNWLVLRIRSMLYTVVFILILLATMLIVVLGSTINGLLREYHIKIPGIFGVFYHLRFGIIFVYLVVLFAMIYRNVPNLTRAERKKYGFLYQLPGAFFCAVSWLALSLGISIYVDDFNGFSIYGSLTKLAVVMVWMYFCLVCMLLGAEINRYYHGEIRSFFGWLRRKRKKKK
ncbi:MAG: YihY/virulence factor BrkB family protein [Ruminococcus sp.]|nr:YihY/virulence factor BrkB family protein [uncultured Ruminococcus sp.]MBQ1349730.1 YihY/virulence factor BrkB family protein [Ruminococcus sp.]MBQ4260733.1 YihY/virulence factor BrkB family protein [Ruminococcus sp.]